MIISSDCYPNKPQQCDKDSLNKEWPKSKTRFLLFTRKNPEVPELLHWCNGTLPKNTNFNPNNKLVVFIPGFMFGTCEVETIPEIKDELLVKEDMNVILVVNVEEYGREFLTAMENVEKVANITTQLLRNIQDKTGIKNENVHLVGHSLGAQVSGLIGQQFRIHRITALDPAGVTYTKDLPLHKRLDPDDADIVDVIHTNGGTGLPYFGAYFPSGDADFYVNGGADQPSCKTSVLKGVTKLNFIYVIGLTSVPTICSHSKVLDYYKLTINSPQKFVAYACSSYKTFKTGNCTGKGATTAVMGFHFEDSFTPEQMKRKFPRKYYIDTDETWSFF
ncbi:pancreatic lipase-related protein 2-like isoform X2 [Argiope bruennichi]|uniref:Pancreatic lipase-related protein 2 like protein n=2 Tax=Argiope bruennichi TaxID=94029 RepID=A0A8T0EBT8_ARGBR|nr:pancreatic lipase-related protein 2-like isoform X2 [Argiope bruennichi]KAF8770476.1 Pancreatic lipase-related protein 2 like protein [Argiope bruennichi]